MTESSPITRTLRSIQYSSALVFSAFLVLHLASPIAALISTSDSATESATSFMLLSRVVYHHPVLEPLLVYGSATAHLLTGLILRLQTSYKATKPGRKLARPSLFHWSGILLVPILLSHVRIHRLLPASDKHANLSPSLFSYSILPFSLSPSRSAHIRISSSIHYSLITLLGVSHSLFGLPAVLRWAGVVPARWTVGRKAIRVRIWTTGVGVAAVGLGAVRMATDAEAGEAVRGLVKERLVGVLREAYFAA